MPTASPRTSGTGRDTTSRSATTTVIAVLTSLGVRCSTPESVEQVAGRRPGRAVAAHAATLHRACASASSARSRCTCRHGEPVAVRVVPEDGGAEHAPWRTSTAMSSRARSAASWSGRRRSSCRPTSPLGWHTIEAVVGDGPDASLTTASLVVTPAYLGLPASMAQQDRAWGFMTQLYSVRSKRSWAHGDLERPRRDRALERRRAGRRLRPGEPAACARPDRAGGAVALPSGDPPLHEPALHPRRGGPGVRLPQRRRPGPRSSGWPSSCGRATPPTCWSTATPSGRRSGRR